MNTTTPADPTVFEDTDRHDIDITEDELLGTHTYEDVLYTGEVDLIDVRTNDTPRDLDESVQKAITVAERRTKPDQPKRVAKAQPAERAFESRSPYVTSAFFNREITGGMDWHTVFRKACESDAYDVSVDTDYVTGTLTITVRRA